MGINIRVILTDNSYTGFPLFPTFRTENSMIFP